MPSRPPTRPAASPTPREAWPELPPLNDWQATLDTLHRWVQVVGKIKLARTPLINHWWNSVFYVTCRGLSTLPMTQSEQRRFQIDFDFVEHQLRVATAAGEHRSFLLEPMTVAEFYRKIMLVMEELGIKVRIWTMPVEIPGPVRRFEEDDEHRSYDPSSVVRFWRALLQADRVFTEFRARFLGKASPVHFFWGAFDLAVTRFSGRPAPQHPGGAPHVGDWVMHEAYSHEVSSAGFWPGTGLGEAAFYAYAYPEPEGFREHPLAPQAAYYHQELREFILPYEAVRAAKAPDAALLAFLQSSYEAAAERARWDRAALERPGGGSK